MNNNRIVFIDKLRAISILLVILCHCVQYIYKNNNSVFLPLVNLSIQSKYFAVISFSISRLGVPFFLLITGYLLIDKEWKKDEINVFYKKYIHLFFVTILWVAFYLTYLYFFSKDNYENNVIESLAFVYKVGKDKTFDHLWYMYSILGFYLIIPIIGKGLKEINYKQLIVPFVIFIFYNSIVPTINVIYRWYNDTSISSLVATNIFSGYAGIYVIIGYYIKRGVFKSLTKKSLFVSAILSFIIVVFMQLHSYTKQIDYNVWYDNLFLIICSVSLFLLLSHIKTDSNSIMNYLSKISFGLYLVHNIILDIIGKIINNLGIINPAKVMVLFVIVTLISVALVSIIRSIPVVGKYITYER